MLGSLTHSVNGCCGINLSWYPVSSKFTVYKCKHWRDFVDSRLYCFSRSVVGCRILMTSLVDVDERWSEREGLCLVAEGCQYRQVAFSSLTVHTCSGCIITGPYLYHWALPISLDPTCITGPYLYHWALPVSLGPTCITGPYLYHWALPVSKLCVVQGH